MWKRSAGALSEKLHRDEDAAQGHDHPAEADGDAEFQLAQIRLGGELFKLHLPRFTDDIDGVCQRSCPLLS